LNAKVQLLRCKDSGQDIFVIIDYARLFDREQDADYTCYKKDQENAKLPPVGACILVFSKRMLSCVLAPLYLSSFFFRLSKNIFD
jgi:hypothetical protein